MRDQLLSLAQRVARRLEARRIKIVFAESCTAGMVSLTLSRVPGISQWHCGSAVTYRRPTKVAWLEVDRADLQRYSPVSEPIARQMALGALHITPEADLAASVTGHLGPNAPPKQDGIIYVSLARRYGDHACESLGTWRHELTLHRRGARQKEATLIVLQTVLQVLDNVEKVPGASKVCV